MDPLENSIAKGGKTIGSPNLRSKGKAIKCEKGNNAAGFHVFEAKAQLFSSNWKKLMRGINDSYRLVLARLDADAAREQTDHRALEHRAAMRSGR